MRIELNFVDKRRDFLLALPRVENHLSRLLATQADKDILLQLRRYKKGADLDMDMAQAIKEVLTFRDERDWKQFHIPKDLAISLCLESSELLEIFQWSEAKELDEKKRERIKEELADVLIYAIYLADSIDVELPDIILKKVKINREKYPVEKALGSSKKYTEL